MFKQSIHAMGRADIFSYFFNAWLKVTSKRTIYMKINSLTISYAGELHELASNSCIFAFWVVSNPRIFEVLCSRGKIPTTWDHVLKRLSTGPTCAKVRVSHVTHHAKSVRSRMC